MQTTSAAKPLFKNDSAKGAVLLLSGLCILLFALQYLLFSSGLVDRPAPGNPLFHIFDVLGRLSPW